jgi:hypothetical protein
MSEEHLALILNFSESMIRMSSFGDNRFVLLKNLKDIPSLFFYEVNSSQTVRASSEAPALLDAVFIERLNSKKSMIFSFSSLIDDKMQNTKDKFGNTLKDRQCYPVTKNNFVHVRLSSSQGGNNA